MLSNEYSADVTTPSGHTSDDASDDVREQDCYDQDEKKQFADGQLHLKAQHSKQSPHSLDLKDVEKGNSGVGGISKDSRNITAELEPENNPNLVQFGGDGDFGNPMNWSRIRKWRITAILAGMTFACTFTSAIFSTAVNATAKEFGVSTEVTTLGTSLFVLGFSFGPILWGPLSELYGRRLPLYIGIGGMCCFGIGVAVALNLYTIMICRFFAGVFGSAPLAVVGGALADFWNPVDRGVTVGVYSMCTFIGPVAAPILGGFITDSYLGWRWTQYIAVIMGERC